MDAFLPFMLFAFVSSITPGPTNILVLTNTSRHGLLAAVPIVMGACAGAAGLVLLVGTGVGDFLARHQTLQTIMSWIGIAWLSWMAWQIFRAPPAAIEIDGTASKGPRLGLWGAASLQLVNPKTWMMALAVVSVFAVGGEQRLSHVLYLSLAFFLISLPCLGVWALLGAGSVRWLRSPRAVQRFNRCMALLLLGSAWLSMLA